MKLHELIVFVLIVAVASFFRLSQLDSAPPGLYPDEAINGNDAIQANDSGSYKLFYSDNNGREGLMINLTALSFKLFRTSTHSIRLVPAIFGILTVIGLYLLTREMFGWYIGAIAASLLAVSFWHVNFSRISFAGILAPFCFVFSAYYLWLGLKHLSKWSFVASGLFLGLGFHTYIAFRIMPLAILILIIAYWHSIKKDFAHDKYTFTRSKLIYGIILMGIAAGAVLAPLAFYFWDNPADISTRTGQVSVLSSENPLTGIITNTFKELAMFNFQGDYNWRHNISGAPQLFWPIGILFIVGLIKSVIKIFSHRKKHGHFSTVHLFLIFWLLISLSPAILSNEGLPHALRSIIAVPVVMILAAEGLWWIFEKADRWYSVHDLHEIKLQQIKVSEHALVSSFTVIALLFAIGLAEYSRYFREWRNNPNTAGAFSQDYVTLGDKLNILPASQKKYVVVNAGGVLVDGVPMPAQTVMFITDTSTPEKQTAKNLYYLTEDQYRAKKYDKHGSVFFLNGNQN